MQDSALDDLDQRLVDAVQISPRAAWAQLAPIVGADAVTLARRWNRLCEQGMVYVTGYGRSGAAGMMALVELDCLPGETLAVAGAIAHDREVTSIDLTAGGRDILLTLGSKEPGGLARWTLERLHQVDGLRAVRSHPVSDLVADARQWRLRTLAEDEVIRVRALVPLAPRPEPHLTSAERAALWEALSADGRMSSRAIAERVGISPRRVNDAIASLLASGQMTIRVDLAREHTPWPVHAWYFLKVPASKVARLGPKLGRIPEVRLVVNVVSQYNVIMSVWLHTLTDVSRLEALIEERLPGIVIAERSLVQRTVKHLGHLLDARGHATGECVPMG